MTDPQNFLQALLQAGGGDSRFPPTSRYHGVPLATHTLPDGRSVAYVQRRLVPPPEAFSILREVRIEQGERSDRLAAREIGDPEQYWQLCDANGVLDPAELEQAERSVRVPLPRGVNGGGTGV